MESTSRLLYAWVRRANDRFNTCSFAFIEDTPLLKPSSQPVEEALKRLGVKRAWMIGDTPDDIIAATGACIVGIGALWSPGAYEPATVRSLQTSGALRVTENDAELTTLLSQVDV